MKLFALFLLAAGRHIAFAAEITGADETPKQIRNVLVRGGGDKAGRKNKSEMLDDLPDEESVHRELQFRPATYDPTLTTTICPVPSPSAPDQYGCPPGKMAVCYWHASSKSNNGGHYHTKCWDHVYDVDPVVPSYLPGSTDKFFAYCGPCHCSDGIVATGLNIKIGKSANNVACPTCAACGGEDSYFVYNPMYATSADHSTLAESMGCQLAVIDSLTENIAALAVLPSGNAFIGGGDFQTPSGTISTVIYIADGSGSWFYDYTSCQKPALYECCPPTGGSFEYCSAVAPA